MRWDALFADMEAQLAAARESVQESEVSERLRTDFAGMELAGRLHSQAGRLLKVDLGLPGSFEGVLTHVGRGWIVLESGGRSSVIALDHAVFIAGMDRFSAAGAPAARLGLASALRGLSRDRAAVRVYPAGQQAAAALDGSVDRVGKDFFELTLIPRGEPRRQGNVRGVYVLPLQSVAAICSVL
ncbi:hypothetical protein MUG94_12625 [Arthrobacter gengyunqii]|uniref:Uncharacterized protein n=1 Tax=Arthrobacter gengyunqii TaxID=2886940 RepID=A0A9X1LYX3_9MICC|nr:hypothetical protein [Arthrobacter gengyunqii]MCC3267961.1 hypothetical protein [Arthrobacter gengyunqii]UOY95383.1 hypothetical protein MUG94_12625 [Arthrobacter gengyunqii]